MILNNIVSIYRVAKSTTIIMYRNPYNIHPKCIIVISSKISFFKKPLSLNSHAHRSYKMNQIVMFIIPKIAY